MSDESERWALIESDPSVFTEMLEKLGVRDVVAEELVSIDKDEVDRVSAGGDVFGFILLFKYTEAASRAVPEASSESDLPSDLYFASQKVENACAMQALLNIILNCTDRIDVGNDLMSFYDYSKGLTPEMRGEMIGQHEKIREVHNSFTAPELLDLEAEREAARRNRRYQTETAYHFTAFVQKGDKIFELDGLRSKPILAATIGAEDRFTSCAVEVLQRRVQQLCAADNTIEFSICAIVQDPLIALDEQKAIKLSLDEDASDIDERIAQIKHARSEGSMANCRRRHNYVPLIIELFRALQEKGKLKEIVEREMIVKGGQ